MKSTDVRERFLRYFEAHGHRRVPSSPLIPAEDPTLLFTNAGMNQFKDVFTGRETRDYRRAVTAQKLSFSPKRRTRAFGRWRSHSRAASSSSV